MRLLVQSAHSLGFASDIPKMSLDTIEAMATAFGVLSRHFEEMYWGKDGPVLPRIIFLSLFLPPRPILHKSNSFADNKPAADHSEVVFA